MLRQQNRNEALNIDHCIIPLCQRNKLTIGDSQGFKHLGFEKNLAGFHSAENVNRIIRPVME
jgi:hypothetical protein